MSVLHKHTNAYAAVAQLDGAVSEVEQRRLEQQGEVYRRLAGWTLDALGLAPGQRVLKVGCGSVLRVAGLATRPRRSVGGSVTIVAGAAAMALVALDMVTSGDPHAVEWLVLLLPFFLGLGLVVAAPVVLAFRLREDGCWAQGGALAASLAVLVHVVSSTCPTLLYRLGGDDVAALAVLLPTALAPLLAAGAGLLLASRFGYLNQYAWVVCIGLGLLAVLAASHVPALAGPGLLLAIDGPLLAGNRLGNRPRSPGITGAVPSQTVGSDSAGGG